jgi:hypothetical protein
MKKDTELVEIHVQAHTPHEVPSKDLKGLVKKAGKRIDTDVDGDTDRNDDKKGELGEFIPGVGNRRLYSTTGTKTAKESFSNWRQELTEVMTDKEDDKKVTEKKVKNKIVINPKLGEAVEAMGGQLIDLVEVAELEQQEKEKQDDKALETKQKKISMVKKQVLLKKMQAVRQGAGADIVAHHEPEGNIVSEEEKKDHEYHMARSQLKTLKNAANRLEKKMGKKGEGELKAWVQSKITKASDYIDTAADYVTNEEKKCAHNIEGEVCPVHGKKQCPAVVEERKPEVEAQGKKIAGYEKAGKYQGLVDKFRKENPGAKRKAKKVPGAKLTVGDQHANQRAFRSKLQSKYGRTKKQQREAEIMSKHTSARD